jgi:phosphatidylglycerophosphate synthase
MLDGAARKLIGPVLDRMGVSLARGGISANQVTLAAFLLGLAAAVAIAFGNFLLGLVLMAFSRLGDGLDGAVAKATVRTDFGGYLDIVLDFAFYGAIPLGFVLHDPGANGLAGAALVFSFYVNGASFLAYAILAERRKMTSVARGAKSIFFTTGLAEATETYIAFAAFCLFPAQFAPIAWVFAAICLYTALSRIVIAARTFG